VRYLIASVVVWLWLIGVATAQPAQVIIIRHAEKPPTGNGLSLQGKERAAALAPYFLGTDALLKHGAPVAIYAQAKKHETSSVRPIETVRPLADALHLTINDKFARDDFKSMVKEIMHADEYNDRTVVICWEHKVIPEIAAACGVSDPPTDFKDVYDRTWIITFRSNQTPRFQDLPQELMFRDSNQ
jgi:hypothetical protein